MAKGGRIGGRSRGGFSHRHHHGFSHSHSLFRNNRSRSGGSGFSNTNHMDTLMNSNIPATLINGVYTLQGGQINVMAQMNQPVNMRIAPNLQVVDISDNPMIGMQPATHMGIYNNPQMNYQGNPMINIQSPPPMMIPMADISGNPMMALQPSTQMHMSPNILNPMQPQPIAQANITVVGVKTENESLCCLMSTLISGVFCIVPLCFMCCMWWKKIVSPKYELSVEFYRLLGVFLRRESTCRMLNLTVVDNGFNAQKARVLYQSLAGSALTGFTFTNLALACNYRQKEADSFVSNMTPLKSLSFSTIITWDDMIL